MINILQTAQRDQLTDTGLNRVFCVDWYPDGTNAFTARPKIEAFATLENLLNAELSVMDEANDLMEWQTAHQMFNEWLTSCK
jgi:hypothetical protein